MLDIPSGRGIAFDTNMLARPTQRRLMTLWCELAGSRIAVLPQVMLELTAKPTFQPPAVAPSAQTRSAVAPPSRGVNNIVNKPVDNNFVDALLSS